MKKSGKKVMLIQMLVILTPFLFYGVIGQDLRALLNDARPLHQAHDLDRIHGAVAGERIEAPQARRLVIHEVVKGDSWWSLARQYGVADPDALALHNKGIKLVVGARVEIPPELAAQP